MDLVNKLKSAVSNVLPIGNPITSEHEIYKHVASAGPGSMWKVYDGVKKSTKQDVSVFILEKKLLERYSRGDRELILESCRKGVSQLTRLKHPKILSVLHPLEESRESLAFATEPVFASLANVLGQKTNLPHPIPSDLHDFKLYDVEIKYGLLQVTESLTFLHNDVKMIHSNICPDSILISKQGSWKLAGFDFCIKNTNIGDQSPYYPFKEWFTHEPAVAQPKLDYLAPEYALTQTCDTSSDMFSLGVVFYAVFNNGKTVFQCQDEFAAFKRNVTQLKKMKASVLDGVPEDVREHVKMLLNTEPSLRPDANQLTKVHFFDDVGAKTLQYLDTLVQRNNLERSQFLKNLPTVVAKMPKRVCLHRILPCLLFESSNNNMVPFILPNIFQMAEQTTDQEFTKYILPGLIPFFKLTDPIQISLIFLQNMSQLLNKTPQADIRNHVLPMIYRSLEYETPQIQELCLSIIPSFAGLIEYASIKNALVPRIRKLIMNTSLLKVRVSCLVCLGKLLEYMDRWYVLDDILPILQEIPSREPAVLMSILGIFKVTMTHPKLGITKEILSSKVIPFLFPLCIDNHLNLHQFNVFIGMVKDMVHQVETEQRNKLEQLDNMEQEQRKLQQYAEDATADEPQENGESRKTGGAMMDSFLRGLGVSSFLSPSSKKPPGSDIKSPVEAKNPLEDSISSPSDPKGPQSPSLSSKMTMQEKQRLANQQEQQQRFQSQQPIKPLVSSPTSSNTGKPKDLTSSLLNSNLMSKQSTFSSQTGMTSTMAGNKSSGSTAFGGTGMNLSQGPMTGSSGMMSNVGSFGTGPSSGISNFSQSSNMASGPRQSKQMDMSSLDNLLPSKTTPTLNQMHRSTPQQGFGSMQPQNAGMMGNTGGMMGNPSGMMGNPSGMMGNSSGMMGNSSGMMGNSSNMMNNQRMPAFGGTGTNSNMTSHPMGQPRISSQQNNTKLSSQELEDLLK